MFVELSLYYWVKSFLNTVMNNNVYTKPIEYTNYANKLGFSS